MSFKHILVPLFGLDSDRTALDAALAIARVHQGHIQALHAVADPLKTTPLMVDVGVAIAEVVAAAERHAEARSAQAKSAFDGWLRASNVTLATDPSHPSATAEFRAEKGRNRAARALRPPHRPHRDGAAEIGHAGSDRGRGRGCSVRRRPPVLLIPPTAPGASGPMLRGSAIISWNGSIEAIRSINAALVLLRTARGCASSTCRIPMPACNRRRTSCTIWRGTGFRHRSPRRRKAAAASPRSSWWPHATRRPAAGDGRLHPQPAQAPGAGRRHQPHDRRRQRAGLHDALIASR